MINKKPSPQPNGGGHALQWCHNERNGISNHWCLDCLLNHLFRCRSKKSLKFCVTGLCEGNPMVTGGFPSQRVSNAENVSIWWCHHGLHCSDVRWASWCLVSTSTLCLTYWPFVRGIIRWSVQSIKKFISASLFFTRFMKDAWIGLLQLNMIYEEQCTSASVLST